MAGKKLLACYRDCADIQLIVESKLLALLNVAQRIDEDAPVFDR